VYYFVIKIVIELLHQLMERLNASVSYFQQDYSWSYQLVVNVTTHNAEWKNG